MVDYRTSLFNLTQSQNNQIANEKPTTTCYKIKEDCKVAMQNTSLHTKFKKNKRRWLQHPQHLKLRSRLWEWSSYAETAPHVQLLLQCLRQPQVSQYLEISAKQAQWDQPIENFIPTHNPAHCYMELKQVILRAPIKEGIVSEEVAEVLISSINSPHCLSNTEPLDQALS
jgi:hypothetical protein